MDHLPITSLQVCYLRYLFWKMQPPKGVDDRWLTYKEPGVGIAFPQRTLAETG